MSTREQFRVLLTKNYGVYGSILISILFSIFGQSWLGLAMIFSFWTCLMAIYTLVLCFVHQIKDKKIILILSLVAIAAFCSGLLNLYYLFY